MLTPLAALAVFAALVSPARASCGSSSCPIDAAGLEAHRPGRLDLDASFQYIDQNAPRSGLHRAAIAEIPNPAHNEVRTVNRILNLRADYNSNARWGAAVLLPLVSRYHEHISVDDGATETWSFTGAGDVTAVGRYFPLERASPASPSVALSAGLKLPTGRTGATNGKEEADVPIQPGSGSWDTLWGVSYEQNVVELPAWTGEHAYLPVFASALYKQNNPGTHGYRFGDEVQTSFGAAYTALRALDVLFQANLRVRMRDYAGRTSEDTSFTGGNFLYMSPGLRLRLSPSWSAYGYLQLPVYQRVNQEQLTADRHWLFGVRCSLF